MNSTFRHLVIDLLDSADGIPQATYEKLVEFSSQNYPNMCDDIWTSTNGAEGNNGFCVYLDEDTAEQLKNKTV
jgi:hypothetical protein